MNPGAKQRKIIQAYIDEIMPAYDAYQAVRHPAWKLYQDTIRLARMEYHAVEARAKATRERELAKLGIKRRDK